MLPKAHPLIRLLDQTLKLLQQQPWDAAALAANTLEAIPTAAALTAAVLAAAAVAAATLAAAAQAARNSGSCGCEAMAVELRLWS